MEFFVIVFIILIIITFIIEIQLLPEKYYKYFKKGIPVYRKFVQIKNVEISTNVLSDELNNQNILRFLHKIVFIEVSDSKIFFSEGIKWPEITVDNSFIIRGLLKIDQNQKISITGYLYWYIVLILGLISSLLFFDEMSFSLWLKVFIVAALLLYILIRSKYRIYNKVYKFVSEKYESIM